MSEQNNNKKQDLSDELIEKRELSEDERIKRAVIIARIALEYRRRYNKRH